MDTNISAGEPIHPAEASPHEPHVETHLGLWDAVSIIVGIIIGVGIFVTPGPNVFAIVPHPAVAIGLWILGRRAGPGRRFLLRRAGEHLSALRRRIRLSHPRFRPAHRLSFRLVATLRDALRQHRRLGLRLRPAHASPCSATPKNRAAIYRSCSPGCRSACSPRSISSASAWARARRTC